jgi:acetyl/propionyl-CoA carboxylase alpha subunit
MFVKHTGFPVLLKASAGGGGKGMRVVRDKSKFARSPGTRTDVRLRDEIEMAKGEAKRSFGDDTLLIERYFEAVKHVEVCSSCSECPLIII